ncbi:MULTISPECIES: lysozyme inhibitor LprI family protein [unclassified Variovorax]|uniref:lysozyme inhibitor LprI family protein n=1 Tax=unclassified Variovorax TaxID=663243 RepID=UPI003F46C0D9
MKRVLATLLAVFAVSGASAASPAKYEPGFQEVLTALAQRSGIPADELRGLLSRCEASQAAMNICAYRDVVAADLKLKHALASKVQQLPACKERLEARIARWEVVRDQGCKRNAAKDYGGGLLEQTAESMCVEHEIVQMTKQVERQRTCKQ